MSSPSVLRSNLVRRDQIAWPVAAAVITIGFLVVFRTAIWSDLQLSINDDRYIQIVAAPVICLFFLYCDRQNIFSRSRLNLMFGIPLLVAAVVLCTAVAVFHPGWDRITELAFVNGALVTLLAAAFLLCFGTRSFRAAIYPMGCLWLAIPLPSGLVAGLTWLYEQGSAVVTYVLLDVAGISVLREGTHFSIPNLDFNVAPECSGIRSGVALMLLAIVIGRLYLRSSGARILLILSTIPNTILKNAVRIAVTTSLGAFVDRKFMDGPFHHQYGGLVFFPVDFVILVPLVWLLMRIERGTGQPQRSSSASEIAAS